MLSLALKIDDYIYADSTLFSNLVVSLWPLVSELSGGPALATETHSSPSTRFDKKHHQSRSKSYQQVQLT